MSDKILKIEVNKYKKSKKIISEKFDIDVIEINFCKSKIKSAYSIEQRNDEVKLHKFNFEIIDGKLESAGINIIYSFLNWSENNYVFCPSALYSGNRFISKQLPYPPMLTAKMMEGVVEPIISDVPRLNVNKGEKSKVQLSVGDMATPCIGFFNSVDKKGFLLFYEQKNELGDFGIIIEESSNRDKMEFSLMSPVVREEVKYGMCTTQVPSDDSGVVIKKGEKITVKFTTHDFCCENLLQFYERFFIYRKDFLNKDNKDERLSFSGAFDLIEKKYNERNWLEEYGFYKSSEARTSIFRHWQTGWVGGLISNLPLGTIGNKLSVSHAEKELDFVVKKLAAPSGFLYGIFCEGKPYGDNFESNDNINIVMSRKNADALFFLAKRLLSKKRKGDYINPDLELTLKNIADAFLRLFNNHGEVGQFIDIQSEKIIIGGSSSAGILGAGLCLAFEHFNDDRYLIVAKKISQYFYDNFVSRGFTNAGPGEIAQCPDSESAFGLLESFMLLYDCTNEDKWLDYARFLAFICSSWCVSYDYVYSKDSQFCIRKIKTTGSVWASVQNKHSAPAICTLSGHAFLKLFRVTKDIKYLELLKDISHNSTQYVNTMERPFIKSYIWHNGKARLEKYLRTKYSNTLLNLRDKGVIKNSSKLFKINFNDYGKMDERVNLSDWEGKNNVGELPGGSCWCEVSVMLTYLEIPSVYILPNSDFIFAFDHVKCKLLSSDGENMTVSFLNPTDREASYRLLVEYQTDKPMKEAEYLNYLTITLKSGESQTKTFAKGEILC